MTNSFPVNVIQLGVKFQKVHWIFINNSLGQKQKKLFFKYQNCWQNTKIEKIFLKTYLKLVKLG